MNEEREIVLFRIDRKVGLLMLGALLVVFGGFALAETLTLTTSYPVPSGIYNQLITTGNSGTVPADTTFNRNAGNTILVPSTNAGGMVGIGTTGPANKLDVVGNIGATGTIQVGTKIASSACGGVGLIAVDALGNILTCKSGIWTAAATSTPQFGNATSYTFSGSGASNGMTTGYHDICVAVGLYQNGNNGWVTMAPSTRNSAGKTNYTVTSTCAAQGCGAGALAVTVNCWDFQ